MPRRGRVLNGVSKVNPDIVIETNEAWQHIDFIQKWKAKGLTVKVENMEAGDYFLNRQKRGLLLERKDSRDFANSVSDNRIWLQIRKMKEQQKLLGCDIAILLEGSLAKITKYTKWNRASIMGAYNAIIDPDGINVPIIGPLPSKAWTIDYIASIVNRSKKVKRKTLKSLRRKLPDVMTMPEKQRFILEGYNGIGPTTADRLLKKYGNVSDAIINVLDWDEIPRLSKDVAKNCARVSNNKYRKR